MPVPFVQKLNRFANSHLSHRDTEKQLQYNDKATRVTGIMPNNAVSLERRGLKNVE